MKNNKSLNIKNLLDNLKIKYRKIDIYTEALTHSSYANEHSVNSNKKIKHYERLEILGDAIVDKIVTEYFFKRYPDYTEAKINDIRKIIVQKDTMIKASDELDLISYTRLGNGVDRKTGLDRIKSNIFESFIGAIYIDQDNEKECFNIVKNTLIKYYEQNELDENVIDYKTQIQEILQSNESKNKRKNNAIFYRLVESSDTNDYFKVELIYGKVIYGVGEGRTKKRAEQDAAKHAIEKYVKPNQKL